MGEFLKGKLKSLKLLRHARRLRHCFCFVLEALADILKFFWKPTAFDKNKVKKILAIRLDRIGDLVLTTPALRALKEGYPGSQLSVLTRRTTKDLIVGLSFVDEVIVFEDFDQDRLVGRLREGHFDVSVGFHPDMLVNYLPWSADIPARVGYKCCGSGLFLTKSLVDDREKRIRHEVTSALEVVAKIGATTRDTSLAVALGKDSEDFADRFFQEN
jgi:ADP-heptose:LPS heptosyltransferase